MYLQNPSIRKTEHTNRKIKDIQTPFKTKLVGNASWRDIHIKVGVVIKY